MLNQLDRITILNSSVMQQRVQSTVIQYALFLLNGNPTAAQATWAKGAMDDPSSMSRKVAPYILNNAVFLGGGTGPITGDTWSGGSSISDSDLQWVVEHAINTHFILPV